MNPYERALVYRYLAFIAYGNQQSESAIKWFEKGLEAPGRTAEEFLGDSSFVMYLGDKLLRDGITALVDRFYEGVENDPVLAAELCQGHATHRNQRPGQHLRVAVLADHGWPLALALAPFLADNPSTTLTIDGGEVGPGHTVTALYAVRTRPGAEGHLPGASFVFWKDLAWDDLQRQFLTPAQMAERLGALGVGQHRERALDLEQIGTREAGTDAGRWYYSVAYRILRGTIHVRQEKRESLGRACATLRDFFRAFPVFRVGLI